MGTSQQKQLFEDYEGFVDKFKPKKTSDDCYTPENIYEVVAQYVENAYNIQRKDMIRPFWPGGDYEQFEYPDNCCVVDNPPFSIVTSICREFQRREVRFFLFCPYLTSTNICKNVPGLTVIVAPVGIRYENGAEVPTCFITNMESETAIRTDVKLFQKLKTANEENLNAVKKQTPKYEYPDEILTVSKVGWFCIHNTEYILPADECCIISEMTEQKKVGKSIFGCGYLLTEKATTERIETEKIAKEKIKEVKEVKVLKWNLSESERQMQKMMERRKEKTL